MVQEADNNNEKKLEFDATGQEVAYISLDQARVLALRHARDNRDFYGRRYAQRDLVWDVLEAEETEDYYEVKLFYRLAGGFRGQPGVEQFTIDKAGPIEFRQILDEPVEQKRLRRLIRHSPDRTTFPGYSSRRDAANYNLAFQGRQMRPDSLKFLLSWTNHRPAKRKISKPLVYDQVSSLGSPFALYDPVTVINPDAPKVD